MLTDQQKKVITDSLDKFSEPLKIYLQANIQLASTIEDFKNCMRQAVDRPDCNADDIRNLGDLAKALNEIPAPGWKDRLASILPSRPENPLSPAQEKLQANLEKCRNLISNAADDIHAPQANRDLTAIATEEFTKENLLQKIIVITELQAALLKAYGANEVQGVKGRPIPLSLKVPNRARDEDMKIFKELIAALNQRNVEMNPLQLSIVKTERINSAPNFAGLSVLLDNGGSTLILYNDEHIRSEPWERWANRMELRGVSGDILPIRFSEMYSRDKMRVLAAAPLVTQSGILVIYQNGKIEIRKNLLEGNLCTSVIIAETNFQFVGDLNQPVESICVKILPSGGILCAAQKGAFFYMRAYRLDSANNKLILIASYQRSFKLFPIKDIFLDEKYITIVCVAGKNSWVYKFSRQQHGQAIHLFLEEPRNFDVPSSIQDLIAVDTDQFIFTSADYDRLNGVIFTKAKAQIFEVVQKKTNRTISKPVAFSVTQGHLSENFFAVLLREEGNNSLVIWSPVHKTRTKLLLTNNNDDITGVTLNYSSGGIENHFFYVHSNGVVKLRVEGFQLKEEISTLQKIQRALFGVPASSVINLNVQNIPLPGQVSNLQTVRQLLPRKSTEEFSSFDNI